MDTDDEEEAVAPLPPEFLKLGSVHRRIELALWDGEIWINTRSLCKAMGPSWDPSFEERRLLLANLPFGMVRGATVASYEAIWATLQGACTWLREWPHPRKYCGRERLAPHMYADVLAYEFPRAIQAQLEKKSTRLTKLRMTMRLTRLRNQARREEKKARSTPKLEQGQ